MLAVGRLVGLYYGADPAGAHAQDPKSFSQKAVTRQAERLRGTSPLRPRARAEAARTLRAQRLVAVHVQEAEESLSLPENAGYLFSTTA